MIATVREAIEQDRLELDVGGGKVLSINTNCNVFIESHRRIEMWRMDEGVLIEM